MASFRNLPILGGKGMPPRPAMARQAEPEVSVETPMAEPDEDDEMNSGDDAKSIAGYVSAAEHCSTCRHMDGSTCGIHGFECEPEGGCLDHEANEEGGGAPVEVIEEVVEEVPVKEK